MDDQRDYAEEAANRADIKREGDEELAAEREGMRPPVVLSLNVEGFGQSESTTREVDREYWEKLTPGARRQLADDLAEAHATNHVDWGWRIYDADDLASAEGGAS